MTEQADALKAAPGARSAIPCGPPSELRGIGHFCGPCARLRSRFSEASPFDFRAANRAVRCGGVPLQPPAPFPCLRRSRTGPRRQGFASPRSRAPYDRSGPLRKAGWVSGKGGERSGAGLQNLNFAALCKLVRCRVLSFVPSTFATEPAESAPPTFLPVVPTMPRVRR